MTARLFPASRLVLVGKVLYSEEFLESLPRACSLFVVSGPIKTDEFQTVEFQNFDEPFRIALDALETAHSSKSLVTKNVCIHAALLELGKIRDALECAKMMEASRCSE